MSAPKVFDVMLQANKSFTENMVERRLDLANNGQSPKVTVLTCADSRVPPELIFGQGLGDLFVIRIAGNVATNEAIASIEYAVAALKTEVVVVLGHSKCGAVGGAVECSGESGPSCLDKLLHAISDDLGGESDVEKAILKNVQKNVARLHENSSIIKDAASQGNLTVMGAIYDLETGVVAPV